MSNVQNTRASTRVHTHYEGRGQGEKGKKKTSELDSRQAPTRKTNYAVDRRQNNTNIKAVSPEQQTC